MSINDSYVTKTGLIKLCETLRREHATQQALIMLLMREREEILADDSCAGTVEINDMAELDKTHRVDYSTEDAQATLRIKVSPK